MFGDPFSGQLNAFVAPRVEKILASTDVKLHTGKTVVCMEGEYHRPRGGCGIAAPLTRFLFSGPAFSTRAESIMYRQWGGDIINMSVIPEAKLARECEIE